MRAREKELKRRSVKLEAFNITLRTLLEQREADRNEIERRILTNIDELGMPCIERLKGAVRRNRRTRLSESPETLRALTSPFLSRLKASACLTATELQSPITSRGGRAPSRSGLSCVSTPGPVDFTGTGSAGN